MEYLAAALIVLWCAAAYAVKGGQHRPLRIWIMRAAGATVDEKANFIEGTEVKRVHKILNRIVDGKTLSAVMFAALVAVIVHFTGWQFPVFLVFGLSAGPLCTVFSFILAAGVWLAAVTPSMGEETGGTGGFKGAWGQYVDALRPDGRKAFKKGYGSQKCLHRGVWHGACFCALFPSYMALWFLVAGGLMPVSAWLGISWEQRAIGATEAKPNASWWRHEWIYGGLCPGLPLAAGFIMIV